MIVSDIKDRLIDLVDETYRLCDDLSKVEDKKFRKKFYIDSLESGLFDVLEHMSHMLSDLHALDMGWKK